MQQGFLSYQRCVAHKRPKQNQLLCACSWTQNRPRALQGLWFDFLLRSLLQEQMDFRGRRMMMVMMWAVRPSPRSAANPAMSPLDPLPKQGWLLAQQSELCYPQAFCTAQLCVHRALPAFPLLQAGGDGQTSPKHRMHQSKKLQHAESNQPYVHTYIPRQGQGAEEAECGQLSLCCQTSRVREGRHSAR